MTFAATRRNKGFTLIELLVIVAVIATMVTMSVVSIRAGQTAARVKGATRDIVASIRHARSVALVMMQPTVVTYSTVRSDDDTVSARIQLDGAKIKSSGGETRQTLSGYPVAAPRERTPAPFGADAEPMLKEGEGQTVEDVLFAPISEDVVRGVRIKVTVGDERLAFEEEEDRQRGNRISVFSNVDYLLGKFNEQKEKEKEKEKERQSEESKAEEDGGFAVDTADQEPVSLVWEANGRCDPHRVWVYPDGSTPDKGLCIKVDRFGAIKVVSGEEADE